MYSSPIMLSKSGQAKTLRRLGFDSGFSESWLQEQLFSYPSCLPVSEIDPGYPEIAPLCMELQAGSGRIDIIAVTPHGRLVIVETKLWRNPDARRIVVGQILDYAKELISWDYSDLQREVSKRLGVKGNSPFLLAQRYFPTLSETQFVDGVAALLSRGDFMMIIAGDGIRKDAEGIVNFLENTAHMRFTLALLEVAVYEDSETGTRIIQPRVQSKTTLIEREYLPGGNYIADPTDDRSDSQEWRDLYKGYWASLLDTLVLDDPDQPMAKPARLGNISFNLPPGTGDTWITAYFSKSDRKVGCMMRFANNATGNDLFETLCEQRKDILTELPDNTEWRERKIVSTQSLGKDAEWPPFDRTSDEFFQRTINAFVNAFRPRLARLVE